MRLDVGRVDGVLLVRAERSDGGAGERIHQHQGIREVETSVVESHMAGRAEAEHVPGNVRPVVRTTYGPDVRPLGVAATRDFHSDTAKLTHVAMKAFDPLSHRCVSDHA